MEQGKGWRNEIDEYLTAFIAMRESFYLASASAEGQPYVQHRGGPQGFLKVIDATTLAFADFGGNRQYITLGNLTENNRVQLFLMDYANSRRVKIWGTAKIVEDDPALMKSLHDPEYGGKPERAMVISVTAWDVNCNQHIPALYTEDHVAKVIEKLQQKITGLETEITKLKDS